MNVWFLLSLRLLLILLLSAVIVTVIAILTPVPAYAPLQENINQQTILPEITSTSTPQPTSRLPEVTNIRPSQATTSAVLTTSVLLDVPFTAQAPLGEWSDPRQDYGCEEASLVMTWYWLNDIKLDGQTAKREITAMSDWELANYGEFRDSSAADTVKLMKEYYNHDQVAIFYNIEAADIKKELALGNLVIVPAAGQLLDNPYYTPPGPLHHMIVIIGYDDQTREFITNDPGTKRGRGLRYDYDIFMNAIRDYETGHAEPVIVNVKTMIVIEKKQ